MFHEPNATRNGIMAALLARENLRGSETALEGEAGFYHAFTGNNRGDLDYTFTGPPHTSLHKVVADLGSRWELLHVTPKIYPTAGYNCPVIELMAEMQAGPSLSPEEIEVITVNMNWLETLYPSPAFPNAQRGAPGLGSTHYFVAYTCVHGAYPPLRNPAGGGDVSSPEAEQVNRLMERVKVVGHKDRSPFAPHITVEMRDGSRREGEFRGDELEWDLATETRRIRELFSDIDFSADRLESIVHAVTQLDTQPRIDPLIRLCVA